MDYTTETLDGGLTLKVHVDTPQGVLTATYHWGTRELAIENRRKAIELALFHAGGAPRGLAGRTGTVKRLKLLGRTFFVGQASGPPAWWAPRFSIRDGALMVGWLRRCYWISREIIPR